MLKPLLLAAALTLPFAAVAQSVSVPVHYADLDLTANAGRATLDRRISMAVRSICGRPTADLGELRAHRACVAESMASASAQKAVALARAERGLRVAQVR